MNKTEDDELGDEELSDEEIRALSEGLCLECIFWGQVFISVLRKGAVMGLINNSL